MVDESLIKSLMPAALAHDAEPAVWRAWLRAIKGFFLVSRLDALPVDVQRAYVIVTSLNPKSPAWPRLFLPGLSTTIQGKVSLLSPDLSLSVAALSVVARSVDSSVTSSVASFVASSVASSVVPLSRALSVNRKRMIERTGGRTDGRTGGRTDGRTDGRT